MIRNKKIMVKKIMVKGVTGVNIRLFIGCGRSPETWCANMPWPQFIILFLLNLKT